MSTQQETRPQPRDGLPGHRDASRGRSTYVLHPLWGGRTRRAPREGFFTKLRTTRWYGSNETPGSDYSDKGRSGGCHAGARRAGEGRGDRRGRPRTCAQTPRTRARTPAGHVPPPARARREAASSPPAAPTPIAVGVTLRTNCPTSTPSCRVDAAESGVPCVCRSGPLGSRPAGALPSPGGTKGDPHAHLGTSVFLPFLRTRERTRCSPFWAQFLDLKIPVPSPRCWKDPVSKT